MKEHELRPASGATKNRKRRGRGNASGLGGEAGRGHKGQRSRSGFSARPGFEGGQTPLYRRIPKKRGLGNPKRSYHKPINLLQLETFFNDNDTVDSIALYEKGLIKLNEKFKVLANGELTKKLTIKGHKISKAAAEKLAASASVFESVE